MSIINFHTKEIAVKVVYYGPGLCGKTTSLQTIYASLPPERKPQIVSLATEVDRTIFFDFLPVTAYRIREFRVRLQLYTVPGQVFYNATRKLVLNGVDGIVFVADSQLAMKDSNLESLQNLEENLLELGLEPDQVPTILQFNKRDLQDIYSVEDMDKLYNPRHLPVFATCAMTGEGLFDAMRAISQMVVNSLLRKGLGKQLGIAPATSASQPAAAPKGGGGLSESLGAAAAAASQANESIGPQGAGKAPGGVAAVGAARAPNVANTPRPSAPRAAAADDDDFSSLNPAAAPSTGDAEPLIGTRVPASASGSTPPVFSVPTDIPAKASAPEARPPASTAGGTGLWPPQAPANLTAPIDHALSKSLWSEATVGIEALVKHLAAQPEAGADSVPSFILMRGVTSTRYRAFVEALNTARSGQPLTRERVMNALLVALECMW